MALLKAELLHAGIRRHGLTLRQWLLSSLDGLGKLGCSMPDFVNAMLDSPRWRSLALKTMGIMKERPLPHYTLERFDHWFAKHPPNRFASRGRVILWDDTFVRYHEPHIGRAAVRVLEAAGFEVVLPAKRKCCGRPAFSQGHLDKARRLGRHNLALLNRDGDHTPIIFLEPSCYAMFVEDYRELNLQDTGPVAARCFLFEQFVDDLLEREPNALQFGARAANVAIHAHCHAKSLTNPAFMKRLAQRLPYRTVTLLETGCCGMAGAFGALQSKYDLSLAVAKPLIEQIQRQPAGTTVVASGTSCRQQIQHLAPVKAQHMAEFLADALGGDLQGG
jgi:Fe-S oxidoreductase